MKSILSDVIFIDLPSLLDTNTIENVLRTKYGELVRWAILDVLDDKLKISVTYEKKEFE